MTKAQMQAKILELQAEIEELKRLRRIRISYD